jgi:hypothetical protein
MASTFTSRFKLEKMETGANANTWGTRTNNNLDVVDAFGGGYIAKSVAGSADVTLTTGNADSTTESANKVIELTGALTGDIKVLVPAVENEYVFFNNTSGSQTLTIAATGHTSNGIAIAQGAYSHVYCEGSANFGIKNSVDKLGATTFVGDATAGGGNIILRTNGAVTATTFIGSGSNLTGVDPFPSGTKQVFYQASAPTGWTQDTAAALGNAAMRVVVGTGGGTGGSDTFQTTFGSSRTTESKSLTVSGSVSGTVGGHTLSTPELASHSHTVSSSQFDNNQPNRPRTLTNRCNYDPSITSNPTSSTGGGGSHSHPFSGTLGSATTGSSSFAMPDMDLKFANVIIAAKD